MLWRSVIQALGYYPFGSHYFSDLLHYVRTGDFVDAPSRLHNITNTPSPSARSPTTRRHRWPPYVNEVTAREYPKLRKQYGPSSL